MSLLFQPGQTDLQYLPPIVATQVTVKDFPFYTDPDTSTDYIRNTAVFPLVQDNGLFYGGLKLTGHGDHPQQGDDHPFFFKPFPVLSTDPDRYPGSNFDQGFLVGYYVPFDLIRDSFTSISASFSALSSFLSTDPLINFSINLGLSRNYPQSITSPRDLEATNTWYASSHPVVSNDPSNYASYTSYACNMSEHFYFHDPAGFPDTWLYIWLECFKRNANMPGQSDLNMLFSNNLFQVSISTSQYAFPTTRNTQG